MNHKLFTIAQIVVCMFVASTIAASASPVPGISGNGTVSTQANGQHSSGAQASPHTPLGSNFTYQGRVQPVPTPDASHNFTFKLYDGSNNLLGTSATTAFVTNGYFTANVDFGPNAFDGSARSLEAYYEGALMGPRQPVTVVPYAMTSLNALNATNATNAVNATNAMTATTALTTINATYAMTATNLAPGEVLDVSMPGPVWKVANEDTNSGVGICGEAGSNGLCQSPDFSGFSKKGPGRPELFFNGAGLLGLSILPNFAGTAGISFAPLGTGVVGINTSNGVGVRGAVLNGAGLPPGFDVNTGVLGSSSIGGVGVGGISSLPGALAPGGTGVAGAGATSGVLGMSPVGAGVIGSTGNASVGPFVNVGVVGSGLPSGVGVGGVIGIGTRLYVNTSVVGSNTANGVGVGGFGSSPNETILTIAPPKTGVMGASTTGPGVVGASGNVLIPGTIVNVGVVGAAAATGVGVAGSVGGATGVWVNSGVVGTSVTGIGVTGMAGPVIGFAPLDTGVFGASSNGPGVLGQNLKVCPNCFAGLFNGNVRVNGAISANVKFFKIDDPLDPANKYLYHTSVESSDMLDIYRGHVTLDANGEASVQMPDWFEALNRDFDYQLTAIGAPAPNLYVAQEMRSNRFKIAGGKAGLKVSWQVTGVRHDPYAQAHPSPVEQAKAPQERGTYLNPELYGQPETKQENYVPIRPTSGSGGAQSGSQPNQTNTSLPGGK